MTTPADGAAVARAFKRGRQILLVNSFHVNALPRARSTCAAELVRRFIETLSPGDTDCASRVPAVRLLPGFAAHAAELEPASGLKGNFADAAQLKLVSAAVLTAGDVLVRLQSNSTGRGPGLRGGSFHIVRRGGHARVLLDGVRWSEDLAVSGTIDAPAGRRGTVRARLAIAGPAGLSGRLRISWQEGVAAARARIRGAFNATAVVAQTAAP